MKITIATDFEPDTDERGDWKFSAICDDGRRWLFSPWQFKNNAEVSRFIDYLANARIVVFDANRKVGRKLVEKILLASKRFAT